MTDSLQENTGSPRPVFSLNSMTNKVGYVLASGLFIVVVTVLAFPYVQARLSPLETLPVTGEVSDAGVTAPVEISEPNTLTIRDLGIVAPVIYIQEKTEQAYQTALREGVVHYPGTAKPGEFGNVYIFGHSSDYAWAPGDYKTIFAKLPQIKMGTEIRVTDEAGNVFRYKVIETKIVWPRDLSVLDQYHFERKMLTLQTSYPLGTALQRYIVIAELQED